VSRTLHWTPEETLIGVAFGERIRLTVRGTPQPPVTFRGVHYAAGGQPVLILVQLGDMPPTRRVPWTSIDAIEPDLSQEASTT
jgi:hypothetical protein